MTVSIQSGLRTRPCKMHSFEYLFYVFCVFNYVLCASGDTRIGRKRLRSSTEISSLEAPELDSVTITEGDSMWGRKKYRLQFATDVDSTVTPYQNDLSFDEKKEPFSTSALKKFLDSYAEKLKNEKFRNATVKKDDISVEETEEGKAKKNWNLKDFEKHKHTFEDKKGWVSLEPVPWSLSQVSRWKNKPNPTDYSYTPQLEDISWESNLNYPSTPSAPTTNLQNYYKYKPPVIVNDYDVYPVESSYNKIKNGYKKPSLPSPIESLQTSFGNQYKQNIIINGENGIITDSMSPNFPQADVDYNRRQGTELYPDTHPFLGNGNWVLLSTSKGYKYPKKQRAIKVQPLTNYHKTVQLTVLPPLKNSNVNMTTSHGGLLQVDATLEPIEHSHKKLQKLKNKRKRPGNLKKKKKVEILRTVSQSAPRSTSSDSGAVLAGVGAGLIPATMAMFVPLAMGGKKRKKRGAFKY